MEGAKFRVFFAVSQKMELSVSYSTVVLRTNFAAHLQFLTWPPLRYRQGSTGRRLPWEETPDLLADLHFGALNLVNGFYQIRWKGFSSSFGFHVSVRAGEFGVLDVLVDPGVDAKVSPDDLL